MTAVELLSSAERPAVVAGSGVWWDGAATELAAFAEHGRLPVFLNGSGRGSLPPGTSCSSSTRAARRSTRPTSSA